MTRTRKVGIPAIELPRLRILTALVVVTVSVTTVLFVLSGRSVSGDTGGVINATIQPVAGLELLIVEITAPASISPGDRFKIEAHIKNPNRSRVKSVTAVLEVSRAGLKVSGQPLHNLGAIGPGAGKSTRWNVLAESTSDPPDAYIVILHVKGVDTETDATVSVSDDAVILLN